jgi:hypothetical protein
MKGRILLSLLITLTIASIQFGQQVITSSDGDTLYISGGTMTGMENQGLLDATINADTTVGVGRNNVNRVYALYEGEVYYQLSAIQVNNPTGVLTIVGVNKVDPNYKTNTNSTVNNGTTKPIILIQPTSGTPVYTADGGSGGATNEIWGSLKFENIQYVTMQTDQTQNNELFFCGTSNSLPQSLTIDNCVFEFCNIDLFDCTSGDSKTGGWPNGAKFKFTNSYFRNMFYQGQWWGGRIFQCKHPIDTLWVENCTVTNGGLTFLQQNQATTFGYFNHNTIVNNYKYWLLGPYWVNLIVTNNIFLNQNWVGEDTNVTYSGQDPDKLFMSTINIDTIDKSVTVPSEYLNSDSTLKSGVSLENRKVFVSDNVNYWDPLLVDGYFTNSTYTIACSGSGGIIAPPSYIGWTFANSPYAIGNMPGEWANSRTTDLLAKYATAKNGGIGQMVMQNTYTTRPNTPTPPIVSAAEVTDMAVWNQNKWSDPRFTSAGTITTDGSGFIYGPDSASMVEGKINGVASNQVYGEGTGIQVGIAKFSEFVENFSQTNIISAIDNLPVGALIWDDAQLAAFSSATDFNKINTAYKAAGGNSLTGIKEVNNLPHSYSLSQNYPNPFNPTTNINFTLQKASNVTLAIYNVLGQRVSTLVNNYMREGSYSFQFNGSKLASGVYFYRIDAGTFTSVKKMILMK